MITLNYYFEETELIAGKPIQNSSHNVPQGDYIIIEFRTFHAFIILVYEQTASLQCLRKRILILFELTLCCLLYPHSGVRLCRMAAHNTVHRQGIFFILRQPPVGQNLLIVEASRSHPDIPQWVGLLWMSDQPEAKTSA